MEIILISCYKFSLYTLWTNSLYYSFSLSSNLFCIFQRYLWLLAIKQQWIWNDVWNLHREHPTGKRSLQKRNGMLGQNKHTYLWVSNIFVSFLDNFMLSIFIRFDSLHLLLSFNCDNFSQQWVMIQFWNILIFSQTLFLHLSLFLIQL